MVSDGEDSNLTCLSLACLSSLDNDIRAYPSRAPFRDSLLGYKIHQPNLMLILGTLSFLTELQRRRKKRPDCHLVSAGSPKVFMTHSWKRQFPVYLKSNLESLFVFSRTGDQGDQKIGGKFAQFLDKVAKTVAKPKKMPKHFFKAKCESKDLHPTFLNS